LALCSTGRVQVKLMTGRGSGPHRAPVHPAHQVLRAHLALQALDQVAVLVAAAQALRSRIRLLMLVDVVGTESQRQLIRPSLPRRLKPDRLG